MTLSNNDHWVYFINIVSNAIQLWCNVYALYMLLGKCKNNLDKNITMREEEKMGRITNENK